MYYKNVYAITAAALGLALAFGVGVAVGQNAPTESKGMKVSPPTTLDLGGEVDGVQGRQLRLRVVTLEPGGVVGIHSHNGRPAVAYVVQGTLTEHLESGDTHERSQGESWVEGKTITHWAENKGGKPVVVVAVDVFKP
ncbi:MAG TPA: cupin domain-containing protein [Burkholderiales bacterium]|nr:cupin domain-containing protein [Burkholderiales bacterium]